MSDFSHLVDDKQANEPNGEAQTDMLKRLMKHAKDLLEIEAEIKDAETLLKKLKESKRKYDQELIPQIMVSLGMEKFTLQTGETLSCKQDISCSVKDINTFYDFLLARGDEAICKTSFETGKLPREIIAAVVKLMQTELGIDATFKNKIHPSTLKSYIKNLCGFGDADAEIPVSQLDETMISVFPFYRVKIK
jgi:hypothetical protein